MPEKTLNKIYFDREMSWLRFNQRVLEEAANPANPLLERLRFISIFASNLDEFFMVRIAGLLQIDREKIFYKDNTIYEDIYSVIQKISKLTGELLEEQYRCFENVRGELEGAGIVIRKFESFQELEQQRLSKFFDDNIMPVLTPLSYDPSHPFPFLTNLGLYLVIAPVEGESSSKSSNPSLCFLEIPDILTRLIHVGEKSEFNFILVEELIEQNLHKLFPTIKFKEVGLIRVTRNLDYSLFEHEVVDLMKSMKQELVTREQQDIVRLEVESRLSESTLDIIKSQNIILEESIYALQRPLQLNDFSVLCDLPLPKLKYEPFNPRLPKVFSTDENIFSVIKKGDILVHHPFESFNVVVELLKSAAVDPDVLAIKQTMYRTGGSSPIIEALVEAARNGKHVTAVVELKARFDEKNNMIWAKELQKEGVVVVFGFVELKTHAKACLIVRKEKDELKRYVHLSTGNYNHQTAKVYTDIGFFTCDPKIAHDVSLMFNLITGINVFKRAKSKQISKEFKSVYIAPLNLRSKILDLIENEIEEARKGKPAEIVAKMNSLVDQQIINKLYKASNAGVKIRLMVRGMCCLIPGVENLSQNIQVKSIIGRFLEHSRVFAFHAAGKIKIFLSSADWMPRNFDRRVEIMWQVSDAKLKVRLMENILNVIWRDTTNTRILLPSGEYKKDTGKGEPFSSHFHFMSEARSKGIKLYPFEQHPNVIKNLAKMKK